MRKYLTVLASFVIMTCIGSVYAWSIIASELIDKHGLAAYQTQVIFGTLIAVFPLTMIVTGKLAVRVKPRYFGYLSGLFFFAGYMLAGCCQGSFVVMLAGIGILGGIATGFGYWVALTSPVLWFPEKRGLITGIASAGFGLGAVFMSEVSEILLNHGYDVYDLLKITGSVYALTIIIFSTIIYQVPVKEEESEPGAETLNFTATPIFKKLFAGIFLGTFAGLLIIGSLGIIGAEYLIPNHYIILGVALFAIANFSGRLVWGFLSDYTGASLSIFLALLFQAVSIYLLDIINLTELSYLTVSSLIGFGFGGNFVLFAKETSQVFGVRKLGTVYPYVFIGYAVAGIAGPLSGGLLYDYSGSFFYAIILASFMSLLGSLLFLNNFIRHRKDEKYK